MIYQDAELYKYSDNQLFVLRRRRFGFVFQSYNLVRELTGWENILLPVMLDNRRADEAYLNQLIDLLGIRDRLNHLPGAMSGGQQQRVSIARALANKPAILFADEPTGIWTGKAAGRCWYMRRTWWPGQMATGAACIKPTGSLMMKSIPRSGTPC